jgi:phage terminase small subunit
MSNKGLTPKQDAFVLAYLETGNASEAYRRAYDVRRMLPATINNNASVLLRHNAIAERIQAHRDATENSATLDRAGVLALITEIATADASKLTEVQVRCCRHCWGVGHRKQWKNPMEWSFALAEAQDRDAAQMAAWEKDVAIGSKRPRPDPVPLPEDTGGYGFDVTASPNPECPVCLGEGHEVVKVKDTRKLKGAAKRLFAGAKRTKEGIEVFMRDQKHALDLLARAHGIVKNDGPNVNVGVNASAPGGTVQTVVIAADPLDAARQYQELMKGN